MEPTLPSETETGYNEITVDTTHFGPKEMVMRKDVPITVRDGTTLLANVFHPPDDGEYPVVLCADIYGKDYLNTDALAHHSTAGAIVTSDFCGWEAPDPGYWVPHDYTIVKVGFRGTSGSEGDAAYPMSQQEAEDYYDIIEWAADQEWSDGHVGTNGVSYLAMTQWRVGQLNPPHLDAMIPWEGVSDLYREWVFHGGIPETGFTNGWLRTQHTRWPDRHTEDLAAAQQEHPLYDDYWDAKRGDLSDITVPLYVGASWRTHGLHNRGTIEGFKQASSEHKWLEVHGRMLWEYYYQRKTLERQRRFFDYFLKDIENDWLDTPRVRLEVRDRYYDGRDRLGKDFPLPETQYTPLYLSAETDSLEFSQPNQPATTTYDSTADPTSEDARATFTVQFDNATEVTGHMKLKLWVSTDDSDDMDLFIGIKKLDKRGNEIYFPDFKHTESGHVASGWLRVSHRELDENRSTPYQPWLKHNRRILLDENEVVPVEIEIWPSSTYYRAGEHLQVVIQGSEIPRSGTKPVPEPETSKNPMKHEDTVNAGHHTIYSGGEHDSHLLLPVVPPME